jgi:hypothetical protein
MLGNGGDAMSTEQLSKYEGFPSDRTLQRWKHDFFNPPMASSVPFVHGRPRLLTDQQLDIIGGFILFCTSAHQGCSLRDIHEFVDIAFNQQLANSTLVGHVHALGFTSHRPASLKYTYGGVDAAKNGVEFLRQYQPLLAKVENWSRVIAIDQISFWDCGVATSSYSLIGG